MWMSTTWNVSLWTQSLMSDSVGALTVGVCTSDLVLSRIIIFIIASDQFSKINIHPNFFWVKKLSAAWSDVSFMKPIFLLTTAALHVLPSFTSSFQVTGVPSLTFHSTASPMMGEFVRSGTAQGGCITFSGWRNENYYSFVIVLWRLSCSRLTSRWSVWAVTPRQDAARRSLNDR